MQEKLEEKDNVIQRLKRELQQKSSMEDEKTDAASEMNDSYEKISVDIVNWYKPMI